MLSAGGANGPFTLSETPDTLGADAGGASGAATDGSNAGFAAGTVPWPQPGGIEDAGGATMGYPDGAPKGNSGCG